LDISDSFFSKENFQVKDIQLVIQTLRKSLVHPVVVIGCVNTVGVVSRMKKKELTQCLLEENVINILEEILRPLMQSWFQPFASINFYYAKIKI